MARAPLIKPDRSNPRRFIRDRLSLTLCPSDVVAWLGDYLDRSLHPSSEELADPHTQWDIDRLIAKIGPQFDRFKSREDALLAALVEVSAIPQGEAPAIWRRLDVRDLAKTCRDFGVDFHAAFAAFVLRSGGHLGPVAQMLAGFGLVEPMRLIDWRAVATLSSESRWTPKQHSSVDSNAEDRDPTTLIFWIAWGGPSILGLALAPLRTATATELTDLARGIGRSIGVWRMRGWHRPDFHLEGHPLDFRTVSPLFAQAAFDILEELRRRVAQNPNLESPSFRQAMVWFAKICCDARESNTLAQDLNPAVHTLAADEVGRVRPTLRANDAVAFDELYQHFFLSVSVLFATGPLWPGIRALLLAMRALQTPALASDLRFWSELDLKDPPKPWNRIPDLLVGCFQHYARRELIGDPELESLRSDFARWCLDQLKPQKEALADGSRPPVETDPNWREGLIRATEELGLNPKGKGHHVLHRVSQSDPDPAVRTAAREAHDTLRQPGPKDPVSPRRLVIRAFWWICQAHLRALGQAVDHEGARRTLESEMRQSDVRSAG